MNSINTRTGTTKGVGVGGYIAPTFGGGKRNKQINFKQKIRNIYLFMT